MQDLSNTDKAINGMSSQTVVTILLGVVELLSFSVMSRLLSQRDFGYYAAVTAITTVFASFSETGIGSAIIQRKEINEKYINNSFTLSLIFGLFISVLLVVCSYPLALYIADVSMTLPLMLMSITLFSNCLSSVNISIMYRRLEFFKVGLISLFSLVVTSLISIILAICDFGYYAILSKAILTSVFTLLITYYYANTKYKIELDKNTFNSIFSFSGWLMASVFFRNLAQQLDRLLMSNLISINALGLYNRPKELITHISSKLGGIFDTALFPVLSQIQDNYDSIKRSYIKSLYLLNFISIIISLCFVFNSELIIRIFFGYEWISVITILQILSFSLIFNFDGRLADCFLRSLGLTKYQFYFRIIEVFFKITGLLIGFRFGILGVAISVLLSDVLMILIKHIYLSLFLKINFTDNLIVIYQSVRGCMVVFPVFIISYYYLSGTLWGNILMLILNICILLIIYIFTPKIPGNYYYENLYPIIKRFKNKLICSK